MAENNNGNAAEEIKKSAREIRQEIFDKSVTLITAGLMFVAGMAWNDAFKTFFETIFAGRNTMITKFFYAITMTVVVALLSWWIVKIINRIQRQ